MLELEDPNIEEEELRLLNKKANAKHKSSLSKHGALSKDVTLLGRNNRTRHVILFTSLASLAIVGGSFLFGGSKTTSTGDTVKKQSRENSTSVFPQEPAEDVKNVSTATEYATTNKDTPSEIVELDRTKEASAEEIENNPLTSLLPTKSDAILPTASANPIAKDSAISTTEEKTQAQNKELAEFGSEEYLQHLDAVARRAMSAILDEYGQENPFTSNYSSTTTTTTSSSSPTMFDWDKIDMTTATEAPESFRRKGNRGNGGWTSPRSWKGLVLRLVQALKHQSEFTVVLAGHSAAAGHGNHFHQSYLMQFHKVIEPVLRQLGVTLIARNQAQGGLGTLQSSLGFNSIYGSDIDLMLWDSGMTENNNVDHIDLFFRQALMVEGRVPVVWGAGGKFDLLKIFHNEADADVGEYGIGWGGIMETKDEDQLEALPWAVQHLKCDQERPDLCKHPHKFCATCWIDRPDKIHPAQTQYEKPHGQVKWHPGWRHHQLQGRTLAFSILLALRDAVDMLRHDGSLATQNMTVYYDKIRSKMQDLNPSLGHCYKLDGVPSRICKTPMKGRTQYTPRANPIETSVSSLLKAAPPGNYLPQNNLKALYDGPDAHNPCFDLPEGAVDVVARIEGNTSSNLHSRGRILATDTNVTTSPLPSTTSMAGVRNTNDSKDDSEAIVPGRGWQIFDEPQGFCDGSYDSVCAKSTFNRCVLYGHHDERGAVLGSEMAGWLVMQLPRFEIQAGIIVLKLHTWYEARDNSRTIKWTSVNNKDAIDEVDHSGGRHEQEFSLNGGQGTNTNITDSLDRRKLRNRMYVTPELNEWFQFEFAIDGVITSWNKTEFLAQKQDIQRMVETITLVDDESFATSSSGVDNGALVEVAIRIRGCNHRCVFGVTHVYWA